MPHAQTYIHTCIYIYTYMYTPKTKIHQIPETQKKTEINQKKKKFERKTAIKTRENAIKTEIKINNPT